ncbi:hypothetical protein KY285_016744 [Solanum tuberosum]|nr:hypothetical protein KY285_016744 [Solanum tuberosum]
MKESLHSCTTEFPTILQYFWYKKGWSPSDQGVLRGWKEDIALWTFSDDGVTPRVEKSLGYLGLLGMSYFVWSGTVWCEIGP